MNRIADDYEKAVIAAAKQNREEMAAWQVKVADLDRRRMERSREARALGAEMAKTIAQLVDTTEDKAREELIFHWQELKTALDIAELEEGELLKRVNLLRSNPPQPLRVVEGMSPRVYLGK